MRVEGILSTVTITIDKKVDSLSKGTMRRGFASDNRKNKEPREYISESPQ